MTAVAATYADGRSARLHSVSLAIRDGSLTISGDAVDRSVPLEAVEITDRLGAAPRLVRFWDGAVCEPLDRREFEAVLAAAGVGHSRVSAWERNLLSLAGCWLVLAVVLTLAYRSLLPALAEELANNLPDPAVEQLSIHTLQVLDRTTFQPSELPPARQSDIRSAFNGLHLPPARGSRPHEVLFRGAPDIGPNALALPSGLLVLFDDLVLLARDDREILGILAHEAGHVAGRHGERELLQNSAVALLVTWFIGDISALAAIAPTALLQAKYSRDFEHEADDYAATMLRAKGISPEHLANILERLESVMDARGGSTIDYLSTHPATRERLDRLRAGASTERGVSPGR